MTSNETEVIKIFKQRKTQDQLYSLLNVTRPLKKNSTNATQTIPQIRKERDATKPIL
jgi:hypothetical protein